MPPSAVHSNHAPTAGSTEIKPAGPSTRTSPEGDPATLSRTLAVSSLPTKRTACGPAVSGTPSGSVAGAVVVPVNAGALSGPTATKRARLLPERASRSTASAARGARAEPSRVWPCPLQKYSSCNLVGPGQAANLGVDIERLAHRLEGDGDSDAVAPTFVQEPALGSGGPWTMPVGGEEGVYAASSVGSCVSGKRADGQLPYLRAAAFIIRTSSSC